MRFPFGATLLCLSFLLDNILQGRQLDWRQPIEIEIVETDFSSLVSLYLPELPLSILLSVFYSPRFTLLYFSLIKRYVGVGRSADFSCYRLFLYVTRGHLLATNMRDWPQFLIAFLCKFSLFLCFSAFQLSVRMV